MVSDHARNCAHGRPDGQRGEEHRVRADGQRKGKADARDGQTDGAKQRQQANEKTEINADRQAGR